MKLTKILNAHHSRLRTGQQKRYAGLKLENGENQLVFKGLETVRSDWTPLAKEFQTILYKMVFNGEDVSEYINEMVQKTKPTNG